MPAAHFTSSRSGASSLRSVVTIPAQKFPVFIFLLRATASTAVETCIYNVNNAIVTPITASSTEVAGVNYQPGHQGSTLTDVVLYQSFTGTRPDTGMGLLGTPGYLETSSAAGVLISVPDKTIIPPFCGLAIATTSTNTALAVSCKGAEIRYAYELDPQGFPVPRRTRR